MGGPRRAFISLRYTVEERRAVVLEGLRRVGYSPVDGITMSPKDGDIMLSWNLIHQAEESARIFRDRGLPVIVMENSSWGNSFAGKSWYTLSRDFHNVATGFPKGGSERWDRLGIDLANWRCESEYPETVILPSRGIGPYGHRMPRDWPDRARARTASTANCRTRRHPGSNKSSSGDESSLERDLAKASQVITWGSGAAIKALMWGIKVESHMPNWIGQQDNTDEGRLAMFRRLAWAQWTLDEIRTGEPMRRLLDAHPEI